MQINIHLSIIICLILIILSLAVILFFVYWKLKKEKRDGDRERERGRGSIAAISMRLKEKNDEIILAYETFANSSQELIKAKQGSVRDLQIYTIEKEKLIKDLERSNKELENFAHLASHDLQEPLRKIMTFGDRLKEQLPGLNENANDSLERMQKAAVRMKNYIDDLLEYSKVTAIPKPYQLTGLGKLTEQVLEDLDLQIKNSNATIRVGTLPTLELNSIQFSKVLQNLISNAIKYHRQDVDPIVSLTSSYCKKERVWNIEISDNGIGIEEKYFERIFKPFERVHGRSTYEGTGIGLAICQKVAHQHNGRITVKSTLGEGSMFIVTLPEKQANEN